MSSENDEPKFKVTDKRKFDSEGRPRKPDEDEESHTGGPAKIGKRPAGKEETSKPAGGPREAPQAERPGGASGAGGPGGGGLGSMGAPPGIGAAGPSAKGEGKGREGEEVDFSAFVMSLATGVLMALGEVPDPSTGRQGPVHLESARHTIDILSMLKEKTAGNLDAEESRMIEQVLYELRMRYMEVVKNLGGSEK